MRMNHQDAFHTATPGESSRLRPWTVAAISTLPWFERLPEREREIATIVYHRGEASPREIQLVLSDGLSNSAIRSMLTRLVGKGVLKRRKEGNKFFYLPAVGGREVEENALKRIVNDYFGGSVHAAALGFINFVGRHDPGLLTELAPVMQLKAQAQQADLSR